MLLARAPAGAVEPQDITGIIVTDASGSAIAQCRPSQQVRYEAIFTLAAPGLAIVRGTVSGQGWSEPLRAKLRVGFMGTYNVAWQGRIPFYARGNAKVDITVYVPFVRQLLTRTGVFTVVFPDAPYTGPESCRTCHPAIYDAWLETKHAPAVGCEACHGPGGDHIATVSPEAIISDPTAGVCRQCHLRNDGGAIETRSGFIVSQQQYNEYVSTKHAAYLQCATCHDAHYSLSQAPKQAIRLSCRSCHILKHAALGMQFVACESCHMPPAVRKVTSTGIGPYRRGDGPAHIWRIKPEALPGQMFLGDSLARDMKGPFLTLDFACLSCHNGLDARLYDFESVQQTATLVH